MIQIKFAGLKKEYPDAEATGYYRKLIQIEAELEIKLDGVVFFQDPYSPVLELARTLIEWKGKISNYSTLLEYIPIESDKVFLRLIRMGPGWRFDSQVPVNPVDTIYSPEDILKSIQEFLDELEREMFSAFGENMYDVITE